MPPAEIMPAHRRNKQGAAHAAAAPTESRKWVFCCSDGDTTSECKMRRIVSLAHGGATSHNLFVKVFCSLRRRNFAAALGTAGKKSIVPPD
jgi:hypothetical protein